MQQRYVRAGHTSRKRHAMWGCLLLVAIGMATMWLLRPTSEAVSGVADPQNATQVALGQTVYVRACAACHGANLEGEPNWKRPLPTGSYPAPPHDATGHTWHHPDTLLFNITKYGGQATAPPGFRSQMPPFKDLLSDEEIWAVLAFIKSRWPPAVQARQAQVNAQQRNTAR